MKYAAKAFKPIALTFELGGLVRLRFMFAIAREDNKILYRLVIDTFITFIPDKD